MVQKRTLFVKSYAVASLLPLRQAGGPSTVQCSSSTVPLPLCPEKKQHSQQFSNSGGCYSAALFTYNSACMEASFNKLGKYESAGIEFVPLRDPVCSIAAWHPLLCRRAKAQLKACQWSFVHILLTIWSRVSLARQINPKGPEEKTHSHRHLQCENTLTCVWS